MEELNNIWNADDELNEEQLMKYVQGKSTAEEAYTVEKNMADSSFINDGVEGLQQFSSPEKINALTQQINESLNNRLANKKHKPRKGINNLSWELITVIAVILLCILAYTIIELVRK
jgi:hypothetical protein